MKKTLKLIDETSDSESVKVWGSVTVIILVGFFIAYRFVPPPPPQRFTIYSGSPSGAYNGFAKRYKELLLKDGFELEVVETKGSIDNLERLLAAKEPGIAFVQGGTARPGDEERCQSLASLYLEPLWVFHRGLAPLQDLRLLRDKPLAIGPEGSGTRAVAVQMLKENGLNLDPKRHLSLADGAAVAALEAGEVEAVFLVSSARSTVVAKLLETEGVHLMSFRRHAAYKSKHPYFTSVVLAEGMIRLDVGIPPSDTILVAPTATLVMRDDLHPALITLMLSVVTRAHEKGGMFEKPGSFPSGLYVDLPLNRDARRYFKSGPSLLLRYLPFWLASLIDRLKIMLLPLITLLLPLIKVAPPIYRWRIRSKIYRWYRILRKIDQELMDGEVEDPEVCKKTLKTLEAELTKVWIPLSYMEEFYNLRIHIRLIQDRIDREFSAESSSRPAAS